MKAGQKVRLILKDGLHYNGLIIEADSHFLLIKDKFSKDVYIAKNEIKTLEVVE